MKFSKLHIFKECYLVSLTYVYTYDTIATIKIKNISISPKCFLMLLGNSSPTSCPFPPLHFLSFCTSLPFLGFLHKWNHIVYIVFVWFLSVCMIILRVIHDVMCVNSSFLFIAGSISLNGYTTIYPLTCL